MGIEERINAKTANIGIIGLGYVGLPLVLRFIDVGFKVTGFDIDAEKIRTLHDGQTYIKHITSQQIKEAITKGFRATTDFSRISEIDVIIICVPTPLNKHREPDITFISNSMDAILPHIKKDQLISLESTSYPGTTEEEILSKIQRKGFKAGENYYVVFSPEREDPGRRDFGLMNTPKVCGGATPKCLAVGELLYSKIVEKVVKVSSLKVAEMTKLLENIHRAVNIGLVNEMKVLSDKMDIDIFEVIRAASTKPFGFVPYFPGPGLGGHCIPIDPFYLTWKAREYGVHTRFIELAGEINSSMPKFVVEKAVWALNSISKSVNGANILLLGVAYKKNIDDYRESPALEIIHLMESLGARLTLVDSFVKEFKIDGKTYYTTEVSKIDFGNFDCSIIVTDHDNVNYEELLEKSRLVVDTRGRYSKDTIKVVRS